MGLSAFTAVAWVQSLVRELRSGKLSGSAEEKQTNKTKPTVVAVKNSTRVRLS